MPRRVSPGGVIALVIVAAFILAGVGWWRYSSRPSYYLRHGQAAARAGDYNTAERFADRLADARHADDAALLRGEILFRQGQYSQALAWFRKIPKENTDRYLDSLIYVAQILIAQKKPRAATDVLAVVVHRNPDFVEAHRWLAAIFYDQGDMTQALAHLQEIARLDPGDYKPYRLSGLIFRDLDEDDFAIRSYLDALQRNPPSETAAEIRHELAHCQFKQFRFNDALATLEGFDGPEATMIRVESLSATSRGSHADELLDAALAKHPTHTGLLRLKGERSRAAGELQNAVESLEKCIAVDPYDHRAHYQLAIVYESLKQGDKSAKHLRRHDELKKLAQEATERSREASRDPWNASVRWRLAELCDSLGKPQLAEMWRAAARACSNVEGR